MQKNNRLFMDVHVIQTLPPSNINRDDTGSPKTAQFGGVRRARVSSQAWKRAMRTYFLEHGGEFQVGVRTKRIVAYVVDKVLEINPEYGEEKAQEEVVKAFQFAGVKTQNMESRALFFLGDFQAEKLAQAVVDGRVNKNEKDNLQAILNDNPEIDIALFGRMVAEDAILNTDASSQVAHAISTHAVESEFDYFTALDDLSLEGESGAGMLGNIEFNSSTLYRYANIAVHDFKDQLGKKGMAVAACQLFVDAFVNSLPTGKVNTFANQTIPSFVMVTLRRDRPVSLVSAFEKPVRGQFESGFIDESVAKLAEEYRKTMRIVDEPLETFYLNLSGQKVEEILGEACRNLRDLLTQMEQVLNEELEEVGE